MDKFKTIAVGGLPHTLNDFRLFLGRLAAPSEGIYQAFNNLLRGFGDDFIVQGCVVSGSTGSFSITEGWILLSGELIKVDAQGPFDEAVDGTFTKVTTFDSRGTKTFLNGSIGETYEINRGVLSGLAGTLDFDGNTFFELKNQADFRDATPAEAGIITLTKKIVEIGDWNMSSTVAITVSLGLTPDQVKTIKTADVMIISDDSAFLDPIDKFTTSNQQSEGGIGGFAGTGIVLVRKTGGIFDSTAYDSTSFNRGFITVEFQT